MGQQFTSIAKGLNLGGFQESKEEFLEKGKKAQIGEIREWKGQKFQKQPNGGWIPVKQGTKGSKKEFSAEEEKWLDRFFDPMDTASAFLDSKELEEDYPNKTIKEFERYISENGQAEDWAVESLVSELHLSNKEATDLLRERNKKLLEEIKKDPEKYGFETEPEKKEGKSSEVRKDLPKMEHGGDEKKDAEAHEKSLAQLKKEGFVVGKDNLLHHEDGRVAKINTKTGEWEISKEASEKHGFEPENKAIAGVKDWIGDEASDQEISDVLDAVEEFVSPSMLKIQANSPLQFGEKVWDRADEIMEKYREHFDHFDGTYSMPDKQLRKILVAIMFDKRNPRA